MRVVFVPSKSISAGRVSVGHVNIGRMSVGNVNSGCATGSGDAVMDAVSGVLRTPPDTWGAYPRTPAGAAGIVKMEMAEFEAASTVETQMREATHLAAACCNFWEQLHAE